MHSIPPMDPPNSAEEYRHVVEDYCHRRTDLVDLAVDTSVEVREEGVLEAVEVECILEA